MQLFIDGMLYRVDPMESEAVIEGTFEIKVDGRSIDQMVPVEWIEAIEAYPTTSRLPQQYNVVGANCGVVLVWTRGANPATTPLFGAATPAMDRVVRPGDEVRIATPVLAGQFEVTEVLPGSLTLLESPTSAPLEVDAELLTSLEVNLGRSLSYSTGVSRGALAGALGGVVVLVTCNFPHFQHYGCLGGSSPEVGALVSVGLGAAIGFVISATRDEVWERARLPD
jgi:hypothetical protein